MSSASEKELCLKVFMLPWLAHGHLTPFLDLAVELSERNFVSYICSTPINLTSITARIPTKHSSRIHLLPLHLPPSSHRHTTNGLPHGHHAALMRSMREAKPAFIALLNTVQPHFLIHDGMLQWAASAAAPPPCPSLAFYTTSAAACSCMFHMTNLGASEFPFADTLMKGGLVLPDDVEPPEDWATDDDEGCDVALLVSTTREIEGRYLDYLSENHPEKRVLPVGAFNQYWTHNDDDHHLDHYDDDVVELMKWLDGKHEHSCVLVSFGSEFFLKKEQMEALAEALEMIMSEVSFIWVVRFPEGEEMKLEEALPQGFLDRVGERGKIVKKWFPQVKVLGHPSIGGFVSHCGWNSLKESLNLGVPIIAMPMHLDQPINANLMSEIGVGVVIERGTGNRRFVKEEISGVIRDVVVGKKGEVLRSRIGQVRKKGIETSREEMDGFVHLLRQLSGKSTAPLS